MSEQTPNSLFLELLNAIDFADRYYDFYEQSPVRKFGNVGTPGAVEMALSQAGLEGMSYDSRERGFSHSEKCGEAHFEFRLYFNECQLELGLIVKTPDWKYGGMFDGLAQAAKCQVQPGFTSDPPYPKIWISDTADLQAAVDFAVGLFAEVRDAVLASELVAGLDISIDTSVDEGDVDESAPDTEQPAQVFDPGPPCRLFRFDPTQMAALTDEKTLIAAIEAAEAPLELGGAWAGLHVVLTGEPPVARPKLLALGHRWSDDPLQMALMGGRSTELAGHYEPYRLLEVDQVEQVARALETITVAQFEALYAPDELEALKIPPGAWHEAAYRRWVTARFESLRDWYLDTARQGMGVLIAID